MTTFWKHFRTSMSLNWIAIKYRRTKATVEPYAHGAGEFFRNHCLIIHNLTIKLLAALQLFAGADIARQLRFQFVTAFSFFNTQMSANARS